MPLGIILLMLGAAGLFWAMGIDTTVSAGLYGTERIHNIGLMNEKQNRMILFGIIAAIGMLAVATGALKSD